MTRTPALFLLFSIVAAIFFFEKISPALIPIIACLAALGICMIFWTGARGEGYAVATLVAAAFFCSVWLVFSLADTPVKNQRIETSGIVSDIRYIGYRQTLTIKTENGNFAVQTYSQEKYKLGEAIEITGWTKNFPQKVQKFWEARGVSAEILSAKIVRLGEQNFSIHSWRQKLHDYFEKLPGTIGGYLNAMWTGIRDDELRQQHVRWGTVHLLAISGFHVGLVVWIAGFIFFFVKKTLLRTVLISSLLWLYILAAGAPPSAVRAGAMFQVAIAAWLVGRPNSAVNCAAAAASLILLFNPFLFWDIGFRLSVVAALTITAMSVLVPRKMMFWFVPASVYFTTYPLIAPAFGGVPAAGLVINFFALQFFAFAFPFMSLTALLNIFVETTDSTLQLFGRAADAVASAVPYQIEWNPYLGTACVLFFLGILCAAIRKNVVSS